MLCSDAYAPAAQPNRQPITADPLNNMGRGQAFVAMSSPGTLGCNSPWLNNTNRAFSPQFMPTAANAVETAAPWATDNPGATQTKTNFDTEDGYGPNWRHSKGCQGGLMESHHSARVLVPEPPLIQSASSQKEVASEAPWERPQADRDSLWASERRQFDSDAPNSGGCIPQEAPGKPVSLAPASAIWSDTNQMAMPNRRQFMGQHTYGGDEEDCHVQRRSTQQIQSCVAGGDRRAGAPSGAGVEQWRPSRKTYEQEYIEDDWKPGRRPRANA